MPSVAGKQDPPKNSSDVSDGFRNLQEYLQKKIRNLEKKKNRLEEYEKRQTKGEALEQQQQEALSTMGTVSGNLEFARELLAQVVDQAKVGKKAEKKLKIEREKGVVELIKSLLLVQSILNELGNEEVKSYFADENCNSGRSLSQQELDMLDVLYQSITPNRDEIGDDETGTRDGRLQQCADNCVSLLEGRERQLNSNSSYKEAKQLIDQLAHLPYFTSSSIPKRPAPQAAAPADDLDDEIDEPEDQQEAMQPQDNEDEDAFHDAPLSPPDSGAVDHAPPAQPPQPIEQQQQQQQQLTLNELRRQCQGQFDFVQDSELDAGAQQSAQGTQEKQAPPAVWNSSQSPKAPANWADDDPMGTNDAEPTELGKAWHQSSWSASGAGATAGMSGSNNQGSNQAPAEDNGPASGSGDVFSSATQSDYLNAQEDDGGFINARGGRNSGQRGGRGGFRGGRGGPPRARGPRNGSFDGRGGGFRGRGRGGGEEGFSRGGNRGEDGFSRGGHRGEDGFSRGGHRGEDGFSRVGHRGGFHDNRGSSTYNRGRGAYRSNNYQQ